MNFFKSIFYKIGQKKRQEKEYINTFLKVTFKNYTLHEYEGELWYINTDTKKFLFFINKENILKYNSYFFYITNMYLNIDKNNFIYLIESILKRNSINLRFICEDMEGNDFTKKINLIEKNSKNTNKVLF